MVLGSGVELEVCVLISLHRPEWRSDSFMSVGVESRLFVRSCGQVLSPPMGGSASANIMLGALWLSTTSRAAMSGIYCVCIPCVILRCRFVSCIPCRLLYGLCHQRVLGGPYVGGG